MNRQYNRDKVRLEIKEAKNDLEKRKSNLDNLEQQKTELLDAMTDVMGAQIDEKTKQIVHEAINSALEENRNKGKEMSDEILSEAKKIESMKLETQESKDVTSEELEKLRKKKSLLDRFGIGGSLETGIGEMSNTIQELGSIIDESIGVMHELESVSQKAGLL